MESSTHVPMVVKWPKSRAGDFVPAGSTIDAIVEMRDVAPTFWDVAGVLSATVEKDEKITGKSMVPLLTGEESKLRDFLDLEHDLVFEPQFHWNALLGEADNLKYVRERSERSLLLALALSPLNFNCVHLLTIAGTSTTRTRVPSSCSTSRATLERCTIWWRRRART